MTPQEQLTRALTSVVRDFGVVRASQAPRVRGALVDVLGPDARTLRNEVDAIVAAATVGVPSVLLEQDAPDVDALVARLTARDITPPLATMALAVWISAITPFRDPTLGAISTPAITALPATDLPDATLRPAGTVTDLPLAAIS